MRKIFLMISTLLLLAAGCTKKAEDTVQPAFVAEAEVEKMFVDGCIESTLKTAQQLNRSDLTKNNITNMCLCNLGYIRKQYSVAQMEAMDGASKAEKEALLKLAVEAGFACSKNLRP